MVNAGPRGGGASAGAPGRVRVLAAVIVTALAAAGFAAWRLAPALLGAALHRSGPPPGAELARLPGRPDEAVAIATPALPADVALARNAAVPFVTTRPTPARAFAFTGSRQDEQRATDCLALAAMAEAGGSDAGQRAVMQVVLNRVRHPAFARTICGVVFEGAQRDSGCQFTFTCDGALARRYSDAAWAAARKRARRALGGYVYAPVGTATHYHTDWVYPYWSPSLDKIARVDTHLFFRWRGFWGTPAAARLPYRGGEPALAAVLGAADPADTAKAEAPATPEAAPTGGLLTGGGSAGELVVRHPDGGAFLVRLAPRTSAPAALAMARRLCGGNGYCRVMAWTGTEPMPHGFPVPPAARARMQFSYVLDDHNAETVQYGCNVFAGIAADHCLPAPAPAREAAIPAAP